ncbi:MAG: hypothetical protein ACRDVO_00005 [Jiangellaceae bacterium]
MGKVIAAITTSVDGYIVGPQDGPEHGLGIGGERLHYWVMGGPWTYADDGRDTDGMHGAATTSRSPRGWAAGSSASTRGSADVVRPAPDARHSA